ncbi:MAG: 3'-5' exonuclease DinG [Chlamydiia bacterium]|nr:3'-5' exonuclease DinG [Chlamydiia bacterium]
MARRALYYDLETTGLKPDSDRIIEIAIYDATNDTSMCTFVNPGMAIPDESTKITGITTDMVKDAPNFKEVALQMLEFCEGEIVLIAHNNDGFDKHFLREEFKRAEVNLPKFPYIDTLKWARKYRPDLPKYNLQYLRELYGIESNNAHRALDDVMVMKQVFEQLTGDLSLEDIYTLLNKKSGPITQMPFGKHRGTPLAKVPKSYLMWLSKSGALDKEDNTELKETLEHLALI